MKSNFPLLEKKDAVGPASPLQASPADQEMKMG
jgi:hypothetical protein